MACGPPALPSAIGSPACCRTARKPSLRCSRRRPLARSGHPVHPISAATASWIDSARFSRRCCSAQTATSTTANDFPAWTCSAGCWRKSLTSNTRSSCRSWAMRLCRKGQNGSVSSGVQMRRSRSSPCRSHTRSTFFIPRARRAYRSASFTAPAARCCSISRSRFCTAIFAATTCCSTSRPAAG